MVMAAVFSPDTYQAYAYPPSNNPFDAHYVDAAAATTPGNTSYNTVKENFTHTVFVEEGTATWCQFCPAMAETLYTVYQSGEYPFYFVALIDDKSPGAADRLRTDYNIGGFPTAFFDGGYRVIVGGDSNPNSYRSRIRACGQRAVQDLNLTLSTEYLGNGDLQISVNITNYQTIHAPLKPFAPTGADEGRLGIQYTFTSNTTDEDGGDLFYLFDWGDGSDSGWVGPFTSGAPATAKHIWATEGDYQITVRAKDRAGHITDWSDPHMIHITPPAFLITLKSGTAQMNMTIINNDDETLPRVNWSLSITGGVFHLINISSNGTKENFAPGDHITVIKKSIVGFGKIKIIVTAETTIYEKEGFVFGPFIFIK
jgi:thiol-disulfide isomerase/thioredoxin